MIKARSEYIDNLKLDVSSEKLKNTQGFWIHYMYKDTGKQGQFKYFKANNMKYAFDQWQTTARKYLRAGKDIIFTLSVGRFPYRQILVSSEPMDSIYT
jgi:predicted NAD-dependent protein-ADP-ribosyltransferase YbiA (DUF1768 family)